MIALIHTLRAFLSGDGALILPELELLLFALGIVVIDRWLGEKEKHWNAILALGGTFFSAFTLYVQLGRIRAMTDANSGPPWLLGFQKSMLADPMFLFFAALLLAATALVILLSARYLLLVGQQRGVFYAWLLFASAGAILGMSAINAFVQVAGLALMALGGCKLVGFFQGEQGTARAVRKYLWQCALSCAALTLSALLLYGLFHTANLGRIGATVELRLQDGVAFGGLTAWRAWFALALAVSGALLLIEVAPFHWFGVDFCENAALPAGSFVTVATKLAGLSLLLRAFSFVILFAQQKWIHVWGGVAILSLLWGNIAALRQTNAIRLFAFGSISHMGFIVLGLVAGNEPGFQGMAYYLGAYVFMTAGALGVLIVLRQHGVAVASLANLDGLYRRSPALALALLIFLLSLGGVPLTAGFVAKYYIVKGLLAAPHPELAAFAVINTLLAAYAYARIAARVFKKPAAETVAREGAPRLTISNGQTVALTAAAFVSLAAGLYPAPFLRIATYVFGQ